MRQSQHHKVLVTGAGGKLGRRVVELLLEDGADVVAGTRNTDALADLAQRGADVRKADFDAPATLESAFRGIDRVLIISSSNTPDDPSRRLRQHLAAVQAAINARVDRIVYTSMLNPEPGSAVPFAPDHYETEQAIEKSGIRFTILRPSWYADSVFMWLPQALAFRKWVTAAGDGRTSYVWRDDLALSATAALLDDADVNRRIAITGPDALAPADVITLVNRIFDTELALVPVSDAEREISLKAAGIPEAAAKFLVALDINTRRGGVDVVTDGMERLTGRRPRSLREFLIQNRAALVAAKEAVNR